MKHSEPGDYAGPVDGPRFHPALIIYAAVAIAFVVAVIAVVA